MITRSSVVLVCNRTSTISYNNYIILQGYSEILVSFFIKTILKF